MADVPQNDTEILTAEKVAKIIADSMPTIVEAAGAKAAETIKDQWEDSLENVVKGQEDKAREARKGAVSLPSDLQAQVQGESAKRQEREEKASAYQTFSAILQTMAQAKTSDPHAILRTMKDKVAANANTRGSGIRTKDVELVEKTIDLQVKDASIMQASQFDNAGILIPEVVLDEIIPLLESMTFVRRRAGGAVTLDRGTLKIGRQNQRPDAFHMDENQDFVISGSKFSDLKLDAKKLAAASVHSREMALYGGPTAATIIARDLMTALAQKEDVTLLRSEGSEYRPRGIRHWMGDDMVNAAPISSYTNNIQNILATLVKMVRQQLTKDLPISNQSNSWAMNPFTWESLYRAHDPNSGISPFKAELDAGRIMGYEIDVTNNVKSGLTVDSVENLSELYFINWDTILVGVIPGIRMETSTEASFKDTDGNLVSAFSKDLVVHKAVQYYDMVMRYDFGAGLTYLPDNWEGETNTP